MTACHMARSKVKVRVMRSRLPVPLKANVSHLAFSDVNKLMVFTFLMKLAYLAVFRTFLLQKLRKL